MGLHAVSLFSGIGGFEEALRRAGIPTVASVEIDTAARGVIADHFPHTALYNDVTEVTGDQLRDAGFVPSRGVLTAGWPCQGNSAAGQRAGMGDHRSGLYWHIDRLLAELQPAWIILENVKGLLSVNGGRDLGAILGSLGNRRYGWAYRVLDAQHWGLPQRRQRIFIVGHLGDRRPPARILLDPDRGRLHLAESKDTRPGTTTRPDSATGSPGRLTASRGVVTAVTASFGAGGPDPAHAQAGWIIPSEYGPRRLSVTEWERIQGFPDGWSATSNGVPQSRSARYKQCGNAVAVPVVEWIARRIAAVDAAALEETRAA